MCFNTLGCAGSVELTSLRVEQYIIEVVSYAQREGLKIQGLTISPFYFDILDQIYKRDKNSILFQTAYGNVVIIRGIHE